jgi:very-short-patch-repair endonuclease
VDAASWARTDREARTVIAMAFQQRLVGLREVSDVLGAMPRAKRRQLAWTASLDAAGGAESLGELDLAALLRQHGLPSPTYQKVRVDASGHRRYLDAYFDEYGVHVEIDGAHHLDATQAWLDYDRQNQLWMSGECVLRFPAWLLRDQPHKVVADIRRALMDRGRLRRL